MLVQLSHQDRHVMIRSPKKGRNENGFDEIATCGFESLIK